MVGSEDEKPLALTDFPMIKLSTCALRPAQHVSAHVSKPRRHPVFNSSFVRTILDLLEQIFDVVEMIECNDEIVQV